jgi:hypothetical protein
MRMRTGAAIASAAAAAAVSVLLMSSCESDSSPNREESARGPGAGSPTASGQSSPRGRPARCSARSEANFPGAFANPRNLVVGPLVLIGGARPTPAGVVEEFGGQKFPLLVRAGHTVTVHLPQSTHNDPGLAYGPFGDDPQRTITFVSCRLGVPSGSSADGAVTFWSGFVTTSAPRCVPLKVYADDARSPRSAALSLGASCPE